MVIAQRRVLARPSSNRQYGDWMRRIQKTVKPPNSCVREDSIKVSYILMRGNARMTRDARVRDLEARCH